MPRHLSPFEQGLFATVRIEAENDKEAWVGTGFYFRFSVGGGDEIIMLVSARHVLEGAAQLRFWCHLKDAAGDPSGRQADILVTDAGSKIIVHPDPAIDLAVLPVGPSVNQILRNGQSVFLKAVDDTVLATSWDWECMDAAQDIFMLCCPLGLFDEHNRFPIFRRGIAASHMAYSYKGRDEFLVDIAAFEGSSGSPIFVNLARKYNRETGMYEDSGMAADLKLVGILTAGPDYTLEEEVQLGRTGAVKMKLPMHLGTVVKVTQLPSLITHVRARLGV